MAQEISNFLAKLDPSLKRRYLRRPMIAFIEALDDPNYQIQSVEGIDDKNLALYISLKTPSFIFHGYCMLPVFKKSRYSFTDETITSWLKHSSNLILHNKEKKLHLGYDTQGVAPLDVYAFLRNFNPYLSKLVMNPKKILRTKSYYLKVHKSSMKQVSTSNAALKKMLGLSMYQVDTMQQMFEKIKANSKR